ncbi:MAG: 16S rRNA (guanine(527)-N(7))-methyltransferase RsmG [Candidatus Acidiferrales bacterium]
MNHISNQRIAEILAEYSIGLDDRSPLLEGIQSYISLLVQWNRSVSLTTVTDPEEIVRFHFGESFFASSLVPITSGRLADIGSGAGFPGLPLKMLAPSLDLTLVESNAKKATFLAEVVRRLDLADVRIFRGRTEEFGGDGSLASSVPFDFITARALGQFDDVLTWSRRYLARSGKLILWLGQENMASISKTEGWIWAAPARIPGSSRRFVLDGSPRG